MDQRQQIIDQAIRLFAEHGPDGLSMRRLAAEIGYTQTVIYRHFAGKDELLAAIVDHGFELLYASVPVLDDEAPAVLEVIGRHYLTFGLANPDLYALMFARRPKALFVVGDDPVKQRRVALLERAAAELAPIAARLRVDAVALVDGLWAHLHGLLALHEVHPEFTAERAHKAFDAMTAVALAWATAVIED